MSVANDSPFVFVYGTLMRGHKLHRHLTRGSGARFVGPAKIRAQLFDIPGEEYPGAVPNGNRHSTVYGELYQMAKPDETLRVLDRIEGCAEGLFRRELVPVWVGRKKLYAWTYFYSQPLHNAVAIPTGRYESRK